jgi:hypothetical protein
MTTSRDPDRLIAAFLDEGPTVLTDRAQDAIRNDVERTNQRAAFGPWRNLIMSRPLVAAAVIVVALVGGLTVYSLLRDPDLGIGTPTETPVAFPVDGDLEKGTTYFHDGFAEPVQFTVPASMSDGRLAGDFTPGNSNNFRVNDFTYGVATFYDGANVVDDLCNPTTLISIPATPEDVGTWLTGATGLTVSDPMEVSVDDSTALAWDIALGDSCVSGGDPPIPDSAFWFQAGEHHRIYAIPTGDDTILGVTWGNDFGGAGEEYLDEMNAAIDDLVGSMTFE